MFPETCRGGLPHPSRELLTGRGVLVPPLARSGELVLQLHEADDLLDDLWRHAARRHLVSRLIDGRLGRWYARAGDADQEGRVFRADGGERHDPSRLADPQQSNLRAVDIAACLQVLEGGHHVAGQIVERGRVPVAGRSADTPLVVPEHRDAAADQEPRKRKHVLAILRAGAVHENDRGMLCRLVIGLMSVPASRTSPFEKRDVFTFLDLDALRQHARARTLALPRQRGDLAGAVALKLDSGFDRKSTPRRRDRRRTGRARSDTASEPRRTRQTRRVDRLAESAESSHIWRYTNAFGPH